MYSTAVELCPEGCQMSLYPHIRIHTFSRTRGTVGTPKQIVCLGSADKGQQCIHQRLLFGSQGWTLLGPTPFAR